MEKKDFLNEENYQKTKTKITTLSLILLIIGVLVGVSLIYVGINKSKNDGPNKTKMKETRLVELTQQINTERTNLETQKTQLENQGIKYNQIAKYTDGKEYDLKIIVNALDPSFGYYKFDEYKNNSITSKYCTLMNEKNNLENNNGLEFRADSFAGTPFIMFGAFMIIASIMFSSMLYISTKKREIMAYHAQQIMPIAQESMEKMAPSVAEVGKTMAETMAPTYGNIAKEIAKGIKEGMNEADKKNQ